MLNNSGLSILLILPRSLIENIIEESLINEGFKFVNKWNCKIKTFMNKRDAVAKGISLV